MLDSETKSLKKYLEAISEKKDDISLVLLSHLYVEYWLEEFIRFSLIKPEKILKSVNLTFSEKLALAESLGFDPDAESGLVEAIKKLNTIRNRIAHKLDYRLTTNDLKLLSTLKFVSGREIEKPKFKIEFPRDELLAFCIALQGYVVGFIEGKKYAQSSKER